MAVVDPREAFAPKPERFELKIHEIKPDDIAPNGDRYVVEVVQMDEKVLFGSILVVTQTAASDGSPMADPTVERRGVFAAVVVRAGNGHLLGLPDPWIVTPTTNGGGTVHQQAASVPMFYGEGDVLLIDHNAKGRALMIVGRECRIVNQIDVLARIEGVHLERRDGAWVQVNE